MRRQTRSKMLNHEVPLLAEAHLTLLQFASFSRQVWSTYLGGNYAYLDSRIASCCTLSDFDLNNTGDQYGVAVSLDETVVRLIETPRVPVGQLGDGAFVCL